MKTPSQKRARDEFARIAGNNRVILTSNWIIGRGRFSTVRRLPAGTKKIDYRYFYIANKTLRTKVEQFKKKYPNCNSFIIIEDLRAFKAD